MFRPMLFLAVAAAIYACAAAPPPTSDSADPIESKGPPKTRFIEQMIEQGRR